MSERILIVEDDGIIAYHLQDSLAELGYEPCGVLMSGEEALAEIPGMQPDLVLMDIRLRGELDGVTTAQQIRTRFDLPVVYLTGHGDDATLERAKRTGAYGYLLKPFDVRDVHSTIALALTKHQMECQLQKAHDELELRVRQRTAELAAANERLQTEIEERKKAQAALQRRNRELTVLNQVTSICSEEQEVLAILEAVCSTLVKSLGVSQAAARFLGDGQGQAHAEAECHDTTATAPAWAGGLPFDRLVGTEKATRRPAALIAGETLADSRSESVQVLMRQSGTAALLVLPLVIDGELVGGLGLGQRQARCFSPEEVALGERVANQVSSALARACLAETQRRLSAAVEQSAGAVLITDVEGKILFVNSAFERTTQFERAEAIGHTPRILKSGRHDVDFYRNLWTTIRSGQVWQGRLVDSRKDGVHFFQDATIAPVRNVHGEIVNYVATMRDVTREMQLEEQFRQAQKMEALGRLAGSIAHDFNNLVTVIHLSATLLDQNPSVEEIYTNHTQRILKTSQRASELVKQLLRFSRQEVVEPEILDLNTVVRDMSEILERLLPRDIRVVPRLAPQLELIKASPSQMEQVILNLVLNARDAMPGGGSLLIETANVVADENGPGFGQVRPGKHVLLAVRDVGVGMDENVIAHLFEPFFTTKAPGIGTGLGLSTVYGIVTQSGGHLRVHSRPGQGTSMEVYLPCLTAQDLIVDSSQALVQAKGGK